jgi:hypothetical protein
MSSSWNYTRPADDCKKGLEPLGLCKASMNDRLGKNPRILDRSRIESRIGLDRLGSILDRSRPKILSEYLIVLTHLVFINIITFK